MTRKTCIRARTQRTLAGIALAALTGGCTKTDLHDSPSDIDTVEQRLVVTPVALDQQGDVGTGYDSGSQAMRLECIAGKMVNSGNTSGFVNLSKSVSASEQCRSDNK